VVQVETEIIQRHLPKVLLAAVLVLAVVGLVFLSEISSSSEDFAALYQIILSVNAIAALVLLVLIGANLTRLYRDFQSNVPGARIEARLVSAFVFLVVAPLVVVYLYSVQFIDEGIDSWFDVDVEQGLGDALDLSRSALDIQMRDNLALTNALADAIYNIDNSNMYQYLPKLRVDAGAQEVSVFSGGSRIVATSSANPAADLPMLPTEELVLSLRRNSSFVSLEPRPDNEYIVRTAVLLPRRAGLGLRILQASYSLDEGLGPLTSSVQNTVTRYAELSFLREPLKDGLVLTLSIVVLVTFLFAVYSAFFFARRLSAPVQNLIAGTRSVARGDFDTRLPSGAGDDIGTLVDSFNDMIEQLDTARSEARRNEAQVENERASIEAILARLSTGVIAVEKNLTLRTANRAAEQLLNQELRSRQGVSLESLAAENSSLRQIVAVFDKQLQKGETDWRKQIEVNIDGNRRVMVCACTALPGSYRSRSGLVLVFDDVTELLLAQREAAWGEVARRLAHEIKNPLTPIQLSAERLRKKLVGSVDTASGELVERATHTIVHQVEAMRDMVDAFSEYARAPALNRTMLDLNHLINQVADLYPPQKNQPTVRLQLSEGLPELKVDALRMRQVLHNLVRNALEALEEQDDAEVIIATSLITSGKSQHVQVTVSDNGPGLPVEDRGKIFEPYVTTKSKGTGLGLAIVKKLIEEHGGVISLESDIGKGTVVKILLPVDDTSSPRKGMADYNNKRRQSA